MFLCIWFLLPVPPRTPVTSLHFNLEKRFWDVTILYRMPGTKQAQLPAVWWMVVLKGSPSPVFTEPLHPLLWQVLSPRDHNEVFSDGLSPHGKETKRDTLSSNDFLVGIRTRNCDYIRLFSKSNKTYSNFVISKHIPIRPREGLNLSGLSLHYLGREKSK